MGFKRISAFLNGGSGFPKLHRDSAGKLAEKENKDYPTHIVSEEELEEAMSVMDDNSISLLSDEVEAQLKEYCPEVYALVADYYQQATEKGFELDDKDLRFKMYQEESLDNGMTN